jgi:hypothetical protein
MSTNEIGPTVIDIGGVVKEVGTPDGGCSLKRGGWGLVVQKNIKN